MIETYGRSFDYLETMSIAQKLKSIFTRKGSKSASNKDQSAKEEFSAKNNQNVDDEKERNKNSDHNVVATSPKDGKKTKWKRLREV